MGVLQKKDAETGMSRDEHAQPTEARWSGEIFSAATLCIVTPWTPGMLRELSCIRYNFSSVSGTENPSSNNGASSIRYTCIQESLMTRNLSSTYIYICMYVRGSKKKNKPVKQSAVK